MDGENSTHVRARLVGDERVLDVEMEVEEGRRHYLLNGKRCRTSDVYGNLISILFCPDDLLLIKRGASLRRDELDGFGCQASKAFRKLAGSYSHAVEQRNRLLKDPYVDEALLDAWDESVALGGATLLIHRVSLFNRLRDEFIGICHEIIPTEDVRCSYVSSVGDDLSDMKRDEIKEILLSQIRSSRVMDIRRQQTLVGPHHDDLLFEIDGRPARTYGSQGQQRSLVIAWKMAEVSLSEEVTGNRPLLLLDDVMSELDEKRRASVLSFVDGSIQTVVSTTNLGYFSNEELARAKVVRYGE